VNYVTSSVIVTSWYCYP